MNVEQAFSISTTVMKMKALTAQLRVELAEIGASPTQILMASNIEQVLSSLEGSLRPIMPAEPDDDTEMEREIAQHPANPREKK